jgi:hypothetical protein
MITGTKKVEMKLNTLHTPAGGKGGGVTPPFSFYPAIKYPIPIYNSAMVYVTKAPKFWDYSQSLVTADILTI